MKCRQTSVFCSLLKTVNNSSWEAPSSSGQVHVLNYPDRLTSYSYASCHRSHYFRSMTTAVTQLKLPLKGDIWNLPIESLLSQLRESNTSQNAQNLIKPYRHDMKHVTKVLQWLKFECDTVSVCVSAFQSTTEGQVPRVPLMNITPNTKPWRVGGSAKAQMHPSASPSVPFPALNQANSCSS